MQPMLVLSGVFIDCSQSSCLVKISEIVSLLCLELYRALIALGDAIFYLLVAQV